jgi:chemotaxis protein methyltransferase CheR
VIDATAPQDLERFSDAVTRCLGLLFDDAKFGFLGEVLQRRLDALKMSSQAYLRMLETQPRRGEFGALARELTVGETYFFRNNEQFRALAEIVLPDRMRARASTKTLRILSAACASGEEAYSIAIIAREVIADPSWDVSIRAVDLNPAALEKAARARYSSWALRETTAEAQRQWFRADGRDVVLDETVRTAVDFEERNLAVDDPELWQPETYDVIFCRNALMYFSPEQARTAIARIARSLAQGGYFFLGHAETLRGLSEDFHLHHTHGAFYYERKDDIEHEAARPAPVAPRSIASPTSLEIFSDAWVDSIRLASERVEALASAPRVTKRPAFAASRTWDLGPALDLMRKERFSEALTSIRDLPPESSGDADALLIEAMLLAHSGGFAAAEAVCRRLLLIDELNAGARYALALCRESQGDRVGAAEHDRVAVYLDPSFAMPRLHLGLLARHVDDREAARRELGQALILLKREEASRLLLFAGGFNREALIALCRSALRDCGGQP